MRSTRCSARQARTLSALAFAVATVFAIPTQVAHACGHEPAASVGGSSSLTTPCSTCPTPTCTMPACIDFGDRPLVRKPAATAAPINDSGCFAVVKKRDSYYEFCSAPGANPGDPTTFQRWGSRNGVTNWLNLGLATGLTSQSWAAGVQCPDPHVSGGALNMYYNVVLTGQVNDGWGIARATSNDLGATWSMHPNPVVLPSATHFPYMPSCIEYQGGWLLTYAWVCRTSVITQPDIHVLWSTDQVNWTQISTIPPSDCSAWDGGSANRPRLVVGPDGTTVYMLYAGYRWNPNALNGCGSPARACAGLGIAVSYDGGQNWAVADEPIFQADAGYWDDSFVVKPTMTVEGDNTILRVYYEGSGAQANGLGVAEGSWEEIEAFVNGARPAGNSTQMLSLAADLPSLSSFISSTPNPTANATTLHVELARPLSGSASLAIFDVSGRFVSELWSGSLEDLPEQIVWDGSQNGGASVAAGRYLARLAAGDRMIASHWITMMR